MEEASTEEVNNNNKFTIVKPEMGFKKSDDGTSNWNFSFLHFLFLLATGIFFSEFSS